MMNVPYPGRGTFGGSLIIACIEGSDVSIAFLPMVAIEYLNGSIVLLSSHLSVI